MSQKYSIDEIDLFAKEIAQLLKGSNQIVFFIGPTGAGKTTLIKHILKSIGLNHMMIKSPTFSLKRTYQHNNLMIHHLDLHRLENQSLDDLELTEEGIYLIEWGNFAKDKIKPDLTVKLEYGSDPNERVISVENL